jgi:predicted O-methyltransferase YrrM
LFQNYQVKSFDLIFAGTWSGKYDELEETLALVAIGGSYVFDDMTPQSN